MLLQKISIDTGRFSSHLHVAVHLVKGWGICSHTYSRIPTASASVILMVK